MSEKCWPREFFDLYVNLETETEPRLLGFPYWDPIRQDILNAGAGHYDDDKSWRQ